MRDSARSFRVAQGCFAVIPIIWPILWVQHRMIESQLRLARERIRNAIEVCAGDLKRERFDLGDEELA